MDMKGHNYSYVFNFEQVFISQEYSTFLHTLSRILNIQLSGYGWKKTGDRSVLGPVVFTCCSFLEVKPIWPTGISMFFFSNWPTMNFIQTCIWPPRTSDRLEHVPGHVQHHGRRQDPPRVHAHPLHPRLLSLALYTKLHRERSGQWILDMDVCSLKGSWTWRHHIHCPEEAKAYIPALVSPHHRLDLLLVLVQPVHRPSQVVRRDELHCTLHHVHILRIQGFEVRLDIVQGGPKVIHGTLALQQKKFQTQ